MTRGPLSEIAASFRREALDILAGRNTALIKRPTRKGQVVLQPLANGYRIDVVGQDRAGRPQRLATAHYHNLSRARAVGRLIGETMGICFEDQTEAKA